MTHNPRDLEWQRRYEENDTPWDKSAPAPALVKALREGNIAGRVLVPGCGRGHDVRALGAVPGVSAVGLDLSPLAVEQAREIARREGAGPNVAFVAGDFFHLPPGIGQPFDWVVEHTCFCALPPELRPDYVRAAAEALRPGGHLFAIFYLTPDVETGPPFAVSREELARLFDPHFTLLDEWVPEEAFEGRDGRELVRVLRKR